MYTYSMSGPITCTSVKGSSCAIREPKDEERGGRATKKVPLNCVLRTTVRSCSGAQQRVVLFFQMKLELAVMLHLSPLVSQM